MNQTKRAKKHRLNKTKKGGGFFDGVKKFFSRNRNEPVVSAQTNNEPKGDTLTKYETSIDSKSNVEEINPSQYETLDGNNIDVVKKRFIDVFSYFAKNGNKKGQMSNILIDTIKENDNSAYRYKPKCNWDLIITQKRLTLDQLDEIVREKSDMEYKRHIIGREYMSGNLLITVLKDKKTVFSTQNIGNPEDKLKLFFNIIDNNENIIRLLAINDMLQIAFTDINFYKTLAEYNPDYNEEYKDLDSCGSDFYYDEDWYHNVKTTIVNITPELYEIFSKNGLSVEHFLNSIPKISNDLYLNEQSLRNPICVVIDLESSTLKHQSIGIWKIGTNEMDCILYVQTKSANFKDPKNVYIDITYNIFWLKNDKIREICSSFNEYLYKYVYYSFNEHLEVNEADEIIKLKNAIKRKKFIAVKPNEKLPNESSTNVSLSIDTESEQSYIGIPETEPQDVEPNGNGLSAKVFNEDKSTFIYKPSVFFVTHQKRLDRFFNNYCLVGDGKQVIPYSTYVANTLPELRITNSKITKIGFRNCVILEINTTHKDLIYEKGVYRVKIIYSGSLEGGKSKYKYISHIKGDLHLDLFITSKSIDFGYNRLFLCRHAEGIHNKLGVVGKVYQSRKVWDAGLTKYGIEEALKAGEAFNNHLSKYEIPELVVGTSYLRRTMLTFAYMYEGFKQTVEIKNKTMYVVPCINEIGSGLENIRSIVKVKSISELNLKNIEQNQIFKASYNLNINWNFFDITKGEWVRKDKETGIICPNPLYIAEELIKYIRPKTETPDTISGGSIRKRITRKTQITRRRRKRKTQQKRNHNKNRRMTRKNI
jgi:hypothetical protein